MLLPLVLDLTTPQPLTPPPLAHTIIYLLLLLLLVPSLSPSLPFAAVLRLLNVTLRICQRASPKPVAAQCHHLHALLPHAPAPCNILWCYLTSVWQAGLAMTLLCSALCSQNTMALVAFRRFHSQLVLSPLPPPFSLTPPSPCLSSLFRSTVFCFCLACDCCCCCCCCLVAFGFACFRFCFLAFSLLCMLTLSCIFLVA